MSSKQWFIDETKANGLTLAVVVVKAEDLSSCRASISSVSLRRGSSLHFYKESNRIRSEAFRRIADMPIEVMLVHVSRDVQPVLARERAIRAVARRATIDIPSRIVFEMDEAAVINDKRWLRDELRGAPDLEYYHIKGPSEAMLWIADGIAWAVQRGGTWKSMIEHLIIETIEA